MRPTGYSDGSGYAATISDGLVLHLLVDDCTKSAGLEIPKCPGAIESKQSCLLL